MKTEIAGKTRQEIIGRASLNIRFIRRLYGIEKSSSRPQYYFPVSPDCYDNHIPSETLTMDFAATTERGLISINTGRDGDLYPTFAYSSMQPTCCLRFRSWHGGTRSPFTYSGLQTLRMAFEIHNNPERLTSLRRMAEQEFSAEDPDSREGLFKVYQLLSRPLSFDVEAWLLNPCKPEMSGRQEINRAHDDHDGTFFGKMILRMISRNCMAARTDLTGFDQESYEKAEERSLERYQIMGISRGYCMIRKPMHVESNYAGKLALWNGFCVLACLMAEDEKTAGGRTPDA